MWVEGGGRGGIIAGWVVTGEGYRLEMTCVCSLAVRLVVMVYMRLPTGRPVPHVRAMRRVWTLYRSFPYSVVSIDILRPAWKGSMEEKQA